MTYFASVNGLPVVSGRLLIPSVGIWTADLQLAGTDAISGSCTVVIGNLTLVGAVYRSQVYGAQVSARLVGGAGGWRTVVGAQGYGSSGGVQLSTVLTDAASACGETISLPVGLQVGSAYTRIATVDAVASDVLWDAVARGFIPGWYVDLTGKTQATTWPASNVSTPFTVTAQRPDEGVVVVATEDYASWLPGASFTAPTLATTFAASGVQHVFDSDGTHRLEILTATPALEGSPPASSSDRFLGAFSSFVARLIAPTRFYGRYAYTISNPTTTTVDAAPVDTMLGLPSLQNVPLVADSLATYTPPNGGACHIMFLDGKRTNPVCVWTEADTSNGPGAITIAPSFLDALAAARVSDTVVVQFPPAMQISGLQGLPVPNQPFIGLLTITTPAVGVIQTGSSNVGIG